MICIDTTVLIDEFRARGDLTAPVNQALLHYRHELLVVPPMAAGEYLEGAATVSEPRWQEALCVLRQREVTAVTLSTSEHYGRIVCFLRKRKMLSGKSQNDLWIAATARERGARLLTRNPHHFEEVPGLEVLRYGV